MSDGMRMKAMVVSLTKKKGMSCGMADLRTVCSGALVFRLCWGVWRSLYHLLGLGRSLHLLVLALAGGKRRARQDGWASEDGLAEGPRNGAHEA